MFLKYLYMSTKAKRRLIEDYKEIKKNKNLQFFSSPLENDLFKWTGTIIGPENTIWKGSLINLILEFSIEYPQVPPKVKFYNLPIEHPNVYKSGELCLDILQNKWSPIYTVSSLLSSIQSLLSDPNPNSPANLVIAELYKKNLEKYNKEVLISVEKSWAL